MTARTIRVKKSVLARLNGSSEPSYQPPSLPKIPKVTGGPKSYGVTRKGKRIVVRFYVTRRQDALFANNGNWFVRDFEEGVIAYGTNKAGYSKSEAIEVARSYCEEYGSWATAPF